MALQDPEMDMFRKLSFIFILGDEQLCHFPNQDLCFTVHCLLSMGISEKHNHMLD